MKRSLFGKTFKQTFLAVPAAALMLGASHAQTTIGINVAGGSYGYQGVYQGVSYLQYFTGFPVTATAFGVSPSNWVTPVGPYTGVIGDTNSTGTYPYSPTPDNSSTTAGLNGSLAVSWTDANTWGTRIGMASAATNNGASYQSPPPGDDEVLWGIFDNTGWSVNLSGLNANFPNGYVIQCISAGKVTTNSQVLFNDGAGVNSWLKFNSIYSVGSGSKNTATPIGLLSTPTFASDAISISTLSRNTSGTTNCSLCGFIITDKPVVSQSPANTITDLGEPLVLSAGAIGITPLSYQWQLNGTNIPGATFASYTNISTSLTAGGNYNVVVTNLYGTAASLTATVTINQAATILSSLPVSVTNYSTMNAKFYAPAGGVSPLTYYWFKNGGLLGNTNAALTLTNLQTMDAGSYQFIVSNAFGSATSSVANLSVIPNLPPYEGFNYSAGNLNGQNDGSSGWNGAWTQESGSGFNGGHAVIPAITPWRGSLSQLATNGNSLLLAASGTADYEDIRSLPTTIGGNGFGTIYLSFVAQITNNSWGGIELVQDSTASLFLGECWQGSKWGWGTRGAPDAVSTIAPSTYSLLVYRFDYTPTNVAVRLYVNPASLSSEPTNASVSGTELTAAFNKIRIVSHGYITGNAGPDGVLDEIRVGGTWASVTPYSIRSDAPFALQLVPGGVIRDSKPSGTPYDGTSFLTTWLASSGPDYNNLTRHGVTQFVQTNNSQIVIPASTAFNTTNGTICFWIQYTAPSSLPGPGSGGAMLFDRRGSDGLLATLAASGGIIQLQYYARSNSAFQNVTVNGNAFVSDGGWHHVAITYDQGTNGAVTIYVDGAQDAQSALPGYSWAWTTNEQVELGRSHDSYWKIYDGQMDDVRLYNRILTPSELTQIYSAGDGDAVLDSSLVGRYNFNTDTGLNGHSLVWPYGILISSPTLGSTAVWTPLTNAVSPQAVIISPATPAQFYRLTGTP